MLTGETLAYVIGAAALFVIQKMGWFPALTPGPTPAPVPVPTPAPAPAPAPQPSAPQMDRELADFIPWLIATKAGQVRLDDQDREGLETVRTLLAALTPTTRTG